MRRFVLAAFALTALAACQPATTEFTEEQKAQVEAEIRALMPEFMSAWEDADVERGFGFWLESAEMGYANRGNVRFGYDQLVEAVRAGFERTASQTFDISEMRVMALAPDVAAVFMKFIHTRTNVDGETSPEDQGVSLMIWVKRDGVWKALWAHESSRPVPESEGL